ncbi:MAG: gamma-glutamyltransferase, partial [Lachnospiraceae bacterium]|nr:gamma-glutamyltransferase [Lachnospiraceae bacterium]
EAYPVGSTLRNPDLANTLDKIAEGGKDAFYKGEIADKIIAQVQKDGGVLTQHTVKMLCAYCFPYYSMYICLYIY